MPWWTLGIILVVLALAASPFLTRARLRRVRTAGTSATAAHRLGDTDVGVLTDDGVIVTTERRRIHAVWDEFMDTLVDFGFGVDPSETPRTAAERIANTPYLPDDVVADVRTLGQAEERARYAARPGSEPSFARATATDPSSLRRAGTVADPITGDPAAAVGHVAMANGNRRFGRLDQRSHAGRS